MNQHDLGICIKSIQKERKKKKKGEVIEDRYVEVDFTILLCMFKILVTNLERKERSVCGAGGGQSLTPHSLPKLPKPLSCVGRIKSSVPQSG